MGIEAQGAVCPLPSLAGRFTPEDILTRRKGKERALRPGGMPCAGVRHRAGEAHA
jgi:hypothetical protein